MINRRNSFAFNVVGDVMLSGDVYVVELAIGSLPFVVYLMMPSDTGVDSVTVTAFE